MKSFSIIHLSDLHISCNEDPTFERIRSNLIEDINSLVSKNHLNIDTITMTGDTVDRGDVNAFKKASDFYSLLLSKLNLSSEKLIIVPGNHDVPRRSILSKFMNDINIDEFNDRTNSEEHWELFETRFKEYFKFIQENNQTDLTHNIFGTLVKNIETQSGCIQFILFNSAWSCTGERDFGNLLIGRWQLEKILELQSELSKPDLTLGLMHHPIDWLHSSEKEAFLGYINEGSLEFDILLHGHIHSGKIDSFSNPDGNILSLVSGLGYPDSKERKNNAPKFSNCRYAIYKFDLDANEISVWLRTSREDGKFVADTSLYLAAKENGQFTIPLKQNLNASDIKHKSIELDPVPIVSEWVGRQDEMSELLNPKLSSVAITGIGGQGKTTLAAEFLRRNSRNENTPFKGSVWVDCRELPDSLHSKVIYLLDALSSGEESVTLYRDENIKDTAKRLLKHLKKHRFLVVFDNIDAYIRADTEGPSKELRPILAEILDNEHLSLVVFTCRPPFNDSRGSFHHIQLSGLTSEDGIELFKKRGITLKGENDERYCTKIVELTKGHPWWLGLIAGQARANQDTLKKCVLKFSKGEVELRASIKEYFGSIWRQLNKDAQKILRYLVESSRPLNENEILQVVELGPSKARQQMRRLVRLGLLEPHEGTTASIMVYQVHPLIREFVHENFTPTSQKPYVYKVLCVFMHPSVVSMLFNSQTIDRDNLFSLSPKSIVDSIETCLNSRNGAQALAILEGYFDVLSDGGYHHEFSSLACRVFDLLDWDKENIIYRSRCITLLQSLVKHLGYMGDFARSSMYLKKYEYYLEPQTLQYLGFLETMTYITWLEGSYQEAASLAVRLEELAEKFNSKAMVINTLTLAIRDSGEYQKALNLLNESTDENEDDTNKAIRFGNIARCFLKLGKYPEAEDLLGKSLLLLLKDNVYICKLNTGYAYLWIAETLLEQEKIKESSAFLKLAEEVWTEYAPGLLSTLSSSRIVKQNKGELVEISLEEAKRIERHFLSTTSMKV